MNAILVSLSAGNLKTAASRHNRALVRAELNAAFQLRPEAVAWLDAAFSKDGKTLLNAGGAIPAGSPIVTAKNFEVAAAGGAKRTLSDYVGLDLPNIDPNRRTGLYAWQYAEYPRSDAAGLPPTLMGLHNEHLSVTHPQSHQGVCGEAIATMEGITREQLDALGLENQRRAAIAIEEGRFDKSLVPVKDDAGNVLLAKDEYPRPHTTAEGLAALKPAFTKIADMPIDEKGTTFRGLINQKCPDLEIAHFHHAGNSSGVVDAAAAVLIGSKEYADKHGFKPRARIVAMANIGDDPTLMLNAPVPAAKKVLAKAGLKKEDIDLWEINEAFAVVAEKFIRDLDLDRSKGIRINTILPGLFATPLLESLPDNIKASLGASVPFPARLGIPAEYASLALEMCRNSYFNAEDVRLDGALRMAPR